MASTTANSIQYGAGLVCLPMSGLGDDSGFWMAQKSGCCGVACPVVCFTVSVVVALSAVWVVRIALARDDR